jgi:hypothetical protein
MRGDDAYLAQQRADMKKLHDDRRARGACVNCGEEVVHRGGRCATCWDRKLAAERAAWNDETKPAHRHRRGYASKRALARDRDAIDLGILDLGGEGG